MNIAVANLTSGGLSGGYRKYLSRLMPLMAADPRVRRLTVFVPSGVDLEVSGAAEVRRWLPEDARRGFPALTRDVASLQADVVFIPTARHASFGSVPTVTMVRNMEPLTVPFGGNTLLEGLRNVARALEARRACRRASRVIAVSEFVRDFVISRWHLDPGRVGVVYHGVDAVAVSQSAADSTTLFTAGSVRPARGLEDVIRALALLPQETRLLIAGQVDRGAEVYAARLRALCASLRLDRRVTWAGSLDPSAMTRAFLNCSAFVMTSRAEACPNIALEAMAHGCASVSVDRRPMPEFFTGAALYYPIGDATVLAERLQAVLRDGGLRIRLRDAARRRAAEFTWERTKDRTLKELARAIG